MSAPSASDAPAALRESQHLVGIVEKAMQNRPEAPESAFQIPPGLVSRVAKNGFFDPQVRAWARRVVAAESKLDARLLPIYARVVPLAERARMLADDLNPNDAVSLDFVEKYAVSSVPNRIGSRPRRQPRRNYVTT